jgi:hypothetical protein
METKMQKITKIVLLVITLSLAAVYAQKPVVILGAGQGIGNAKAPSHQTANRTLTNDTTYILSGWYFVDSTFSLTIQKGTVIRGDKESQGTLIVKRGAQIFANGTKEQPIIFTSNQAIGARVPGDWGGVIVLGKAPTNKPVTQTIEGGFGTAADNIAQYGGSDPEDNSGVIRYVRIEYAGIAFSQDNEINGLTFGGVGRGTNVEFVQVSYANDDDVECFGGTVDLKHVVTIGNIDDNFDTDFGYDGRIQFIYSVRDPQYFDASASGQSNGFESDNEGTAPYSATPRTKARISNFTLVGPLSDTSVTINAKWGHLSLLRRASELSIYNSILVGYPLGLNIRDSLTQQAAQQSRLEVMSTSIATRNANQVLISFSPTTPVATGFVVTDWFKGLNGYPVTNNLGASGPRTGMDVGLPLTAWLLNTSNNAIPALTSEAATAGTSFGGRLAGDTWFDATPTYRGAFDPSKPKDQQWDYGWTNYDPQNYDAVASANTVTLSSGWNLVSSPRVAANLAPASVFPGNSAFWGYSTGSYTTPSTMTVGEGYWAYYGLGNSVNISGTDVQTVSMTVASGNRWVIVGSVSSTVPVSALTSSVPSSISAIWEWTGSGYVVPTVLKPGKAYWVYVNSPCVLTVTSGFTANK